jgi:antirestriction protein ArdC
MISFYQKVTDLILLQLENGTAPWIRPWKLTAGRNTPCNALTNRPYSGINTVLLWQTVGHGFSVPRFLTFKQTNALGGRVRKGQNGFKVYFVKRQQKKVEDENVDDTIKTYTVLREYTVFNIDQCADLPSHITDPPNPASLNHDERLELADDFISQSGVDIRFGSGEAYYAPGANFVTIPNWEAFQSRDGYYNTLFHELTHATGHKDRLNRDLKGRFGERAYAAEELVAELGAAYLCAEFGIDNACRSASYIKSWISLLKHDNRAIFTAASKASQAAEWLRQQALKECSTSQLPTLASPSIQPEINPRSLSDMNLRSIVNITDHRLVKNGNSITDSRMVKTLG